MLMKRANIMRFRAFDDVQFSLGKRITIIAGHNRTGKSTILALLGHCAQIRGAKFRSLLKTSFQCEWSEIIKTSDKDEKSSHFASLYFIDSQEDAVEKEFQYRSTRQEEEGRFRILPKMFDGVTTAKKLTWPTMYLGLSRLFPLGESHEVNIDPTNLSQWNDDLRKAYNRILGIPVEDIRSVSTLNLSELTKKSVGIETDLYGPVSNSAGEDNVGQIILAVLSFKKLKDELGESWKGGMLLIDELDATLHPKALNQIFDYLSESSKQIGFQIVFTTHSLSLLHYISKKVEYNLPDRLNDYELVYLTRSNGPVRSYPNVTYQAISNDMYVERSTSSNAWRQLTVYSEDSEARWLIGKLIPNHIMKIVMPEIKMGYNQLLQLLSRDYKHFSTHLFILDGDVKNTEIDAAARSAHVQKLKNLIRLPGNGKSIEECLFEFIRDLDKGHQLFSDPIHFENGFTYQCMIIENGPFSESYTRLEENREKYKAWLNDNLLFFESAIQYWIDDNAGMTNAFREQFIKAFNYAAGVQGVPQI